MRASSDHSAIWRVPAIGGVDAFRATVERFAYARHSHDCYAFGPVDTGAMRFWYRGAEHVVPAGGVITLNPGEVHDGHSASEAACRYRMLYVERATIDEMFTVDAPHIRDVVAINGPELRDAELMRAFGRFHRLVDQDRNAAASPIEQQTELFQVLHLLFARHGAPALHWPQIHVERDFVARPRNTWRPISASRSGSTRWRKPSGSAPIISCAASSARRAWRRMPI